VKSRLKPLLDLSERKLHVDQAVSKPNKNVNGNWMYTVSADGSRSCSPAADRRLVSLNQDKKLGTRLFKYFMTVY
jgi:hypothetical protein